MLSFLMLIGFAHADDTHGTKTQYKYDAEPVTTICCPCIALSVRVVARYPEILNPSTPALAD
jgi:hypothetical protein